MKKSKFRFMLNFEKEERWINKMSEQGWHLDRFMLGRFVFHQGQAGEYIYRNEYIMDKSKREKEEYIQFLADSGIELVHESFGWIYTRKKADDGEYEIFSDKQSKKAYYTKILQYMLILFIVNIFLALSNLTYLNKMSSTSWLNTTAGLIGLTACIILFFPIRFLIQQKRRLEKEQGLFE